MKILKKISLASSIAALMILSLPIIAKADAAAGDIIVTLGEDLSLTQKEQLLTEMQVEENDVQIVYVKNSDEHKYLSSYIPVSQIGTKAISSAKITLGEKNTGLIVESKNISYITDEMYLNALSTAGVKDAKVYVTAPFSVSGTGALTGVIQAYEVSSGKKIDEEQKQAANEEMVTTAELASDNEIGQEKATNFMNTVKEEITKQEPKNAEEVKTIIENVAINMNINLSTEQLDQLVNLFNKIKDFNIDWEAVNNTLDKAKDKWNNFAASEEGKNFLDTLISFFESIVDWFSSLIPSNN